MGGLNTGNGNKMFEFPLVGWTARGGMPVQFSLYHNSEGNHNSELGYRWTFSYDVYAVPDATSGAVSWHWGNDLHYTFGLNSDGTYNVPTGIHDVLVANKTAGVITSYDLTTTNQIKYHMTHQPGHAYYLASISDRNGNTIVVNHDTGDNVTTVVDPSGRTITLGYDVNGRISTVTDSASRVWNIAYTSGNLSSITWPVPATGVTAPVQSFTYASTGPIATYTDRRSKVWNYTWYSDNSLSTETDPLGNQSSYDYSYDGGTGIGTFTATDANSHTTKQTYVNGLHKSTVDGAGNADVFSYDGSFNKTGITDSRGKNWVYSYNSSGTVAYATDPLSQATYYTYNATNDVLTVTLQSGISTKNTYDSSGNLTKSEAKNSSGTVVSSTNYAYNSYGKVITKTDDNGHATTYDYNTNGDMTSVTTPNSHAVTLGYNSLGVVTSKTDSRGNVTALTLDNWYRTTITTYPSGTNPTFTYNNNNELTGWTDAWGTWVRTYDDDGRLLTESKGGTTELTNTYDATGQKGLLSTMTDANGRTISYAYSNRNQLTSVAESSQTAYYTYDAAGLETGITNENGTTVTKVYDDAGRLTSITNKTSGGTSISSFGYTYNTDNLRAMATEYDGSVVTYGYDAQQHLVSEARTGTNPYSYVYTVDGVGNRTTKSVSGTSTSYTYDADDRLTAVGSDTYSYDADGQQTSKTVGGTTNNFAYTFDGLIDYYNTGGSGTVSFGYDAIGRRLFRNAGGVTTRYYYADGHVLLETQAGTVTATYAYGNELLRKDGEYPLFDGQGNERTVTNSSQTVTGTLNQDAFGNTVGSTGSSASPFMYGATSGYQNNGDAGLTYIAARYYDPGVGRFTTRDIYLDQHPYLYCDHDPVNAVDPSGNFRVIPVSWYRLLPSWIKGAFGWTTEYVEMGGTVLKPVSVPLRLTGGGMLGYAIGLYHATTGAYNFSKNTLVPSRPGQWVTDKIANFQVWLDKKIGYGGF